MTLSTLREATAALIAADPFDPAEWQGAWQYLYGVLRDIGLTMSEATAYIHGAITYKWDGAA